MKTLREALITTVKAGGGYIAKYADDDYRVFEGNMRVGEFLNGRWVDFQGEGTRIPTGLGAYGKIDYLDEDTHDDNCMCTDCFEAYVILMGCRI